jgi:hypothetical protein
MPYDYYLEVGVGVDLKPLRLATCVFLASIFVAGEATAGDVVTMTAKQLLDECSSANANVECRNDWGGTIEMAWLVDLAGPPDASPRARAYCVPVGVRDDTEYEAVRAWVRDHAKTWAMPATSAIDLALKALYGCRK